MVESKDVHTLRASHVRQAAEYGSDLGANVVIAIAERTRVPASVAEKAIANMAEIVRVRER